MKTNKNTLQKTLMGLYGLAILQALLTGCSNTTATTDDKTRSSGHLKVLDESAWTNETVALNKNKTNIFFMVAPSKGMNSDQISHPFMKG